MRPSPLRLLCLSACAAATVQAAEAELPPGLAGGNLKIVVGFAAGGAADTVARLYAEHLKDAGFGSILVDNKPGASARLAWGVVKNSKADGLTLYLAPSPLLTILPLTYKTPGYDAEKDLTPVALLVEIPTAVVTGASQPYSTMGQYVEWAKKNPTKSTLGLATIGSSGHLGAFALAKAQGFEVTPVAYRGASPMLTDLVGGELSIGWDAAASMMPLYKGGKIKFLGLSGDRRLPALPEVPTAKEQGFPEFAAATSWYGVYAPAGTPPAALAALEKSFLVAAAKPELARRLEAAGLVAHAEGRADLAQRAQRERRNWEPIVKAAGIVVDE
ncbi:MAG TPA: tripartite tricarboxylate transporter substrate-binding protein [Burkholderiaceae bacterium]|nr:tripartite tricarboxylate transporter substrate-binding protein [Burkholderiaceae bacterium]